MFFKLLSPHFGMRGLVPCLLVLLLPACSSVLPPAQTLSDARQTLQAARAIHAEDYVPATLAFAEFHLQAAENEVASGPHAYDYANFHAQNAKEAAKQAHQIVQDFLAAEAAIQTTVEMGALWRDTEALLQEARRAARDHQLQHSQKLIEQVRRQTQLAQEQAENEIQRLRQQPQLP